MKSLSKALWCGLVVALVSLASSAGATIQWTATVTLSDPADGAIIHTGGTPNVAVTVDSVDHQVYIIGAGSGQHFNVTYTMSLEYDITVIAIDDTAGLLVTCDANGYWEHLADGTGSMSATANAFTGYRPFTAYATISNNGGAGTASHSDQHHATINNP